MSRLAVLDVGTHSFRLQVAEVSARGELRLGLSVKEPAPFLAASLAAGWLSQDEIERAVESLRRLQQQAQRERPEALLCFATSAVREAQNRAQLIDAAQAAGIPLVVLPARDEARLSFLGAREALKLGKRPSLLADIGGGSLELVVADRNGIKATQSFPLGTLRLSAELGAEVPAPEARGALAERLHARLEGFVSRARRAGCETLHLTGGTPRALAKLLKTEELSFRALYELEGVLFSLPRGQRELRFALSPRRAEAAPLGALLARVLAEGLGLDVLRVVRAGLREGILLDHAAQARAAARAGRA